MIKMQITQKLVAAQPRSGTAEMSRCQSVSYKNKLLHNCESHIHSVNLSLL